MGDNVVLYINTLVAPFQVELFCKPNSSEQGAEVEREGAHQNWAANKNKLSFYFF